MKFGVCLPNCREGGAYPAGRGFGTPHGATTIALAAEELGFDSVWTDDHLAPHGLPSDQHVDYMEALTILAYLARATRRVRLGCGVLVLPLREPVLLARQAVTIDHLSAGRFVLGVGIGSDRAELETVLPLHCKMHRWRVMEERVRALQTLFSEPVASFSTECTAFDHIQLDPKPYQQLLPIHIATHLPKNLPKVAALASGWHVAGLSPEALAENVGLLRRELLAVGKDPAAFEVVLYFWVRLAEDRATAADAALRASPALSKRGNVDSPMYQIGHPDEVAASLSSFARAGATTSVLLFIGDAPDEAAEQAARFAQEVMPRVGR